jgi:cell division protease FtsH
MSKDKNPKNFKFNAYWVYGIVIGLFLVFNIFSGGIWRIKWSHHNTL